jgi:hypothetical protein
VKAEFIKQENHLDLRLIAECNEDKILFQIFKEQAEENGFNSNDLCGLYSNEETQHIPKELIIRQKQNDKCPVDAK